MISSAVTLKWPRLYYGWVIVVLTFMINITTGLLPPVFGLFVLSMQKDLGWDRATLVVATSIATLLGMVLRPVAGMLIDKYGERPLMVCAGTIGGIAIALTSLVNAPWQFYLAYGILGTALLGSVSQQVTSVIVAKWFIAKRGRALSFASTGISLGSLLGVAVATFTIAVVG